jgi:hypothetical protein
MIAGVPFWLYPKPPIQMQRTCVTVSEKSSKQSKIQGTPVGVPGPKKILWLLRWESIAATDRVIFAHFKSPVASMPLVSYCRLTNLVHVFVLVSVRGTCSRLTSLSSGARTGSANVRRGLSVIWVSPQSGDQDGALQVTGLEIIREPTQPTSSRTLCRQIPAIKESVRLSTC